jgi:hypothetical protein
VTDTQTLSNKTLTAPVINSPTITGGTITGTVITDPSLMDVVVSPSTATDVALTVNAHVSQSVDSLRVFDKTGDKRLSLDSTGSVQVQTTSAGAGMSISTKVGTPNGNAAFDIRNATADTVLFIGNGGAFEARPRGAENGIVVNSPASFTGVAFRYFNNSVVKFSVLNDGSIDTTAGINATGNITSSAGSITATVGNVSAGGTIGSTGSNTGSSNFNTGVWAAYTPAWTAAVNPAIGNGSLTGRFVRIGRMITVHIRMRAGTTTTFGTGNWVFSLPTGTRAAGSLDLVSGTSLTFDDSTTSVSNSIVFSDTTGASGTIQTPWNSAFPMAWTNLDVMSIDFAYEANS